MKIAIDIRTAAGEKAGKGWFTFNITRKLLELDHDNDYILYTKNPIPGFEEFKNAKLKQIKGGHMIWHRNVIKDAKSELVDVFYAPSSYIIPALLPKDIKSIVTVHDLVAFLYPKTHNKKAVILERLFLKRAARRATHITAVSNNTKRDVIEKFKIPENNISVVYCGGSDNYKPVEKSKLKKFVTETNLPSKFFLAVGTIEPRKNYLNLIEGFGQLQKVFPNYHLIIVGKEGWGNENMHELIAQNYLQKNVHQLGYLSTKSLVGLYNLATALVFPSIYEGFGIPPLEAMMCGCPVIASNTSSIPEVVGEAGVYIDPNSPKSIATAMAKLIKDEELREDLRNAGLTQSKKFDWDDSAKKLLDIFKSTQKMA